MHHMTRGRSASWVGFGVVGGGGVGQTLPQDTWDTTGYGQQARDTHSCEI